MYAVMLVVDLESWVRIDLTTRRAASVVNFPNDIVRLISGGGV